MRALVSGSAGFIGRHMVAELITRGYSVDAFDVRYAKHPVGSNFIHADSKLIDHKSAYDLVVHCAYHVGGRSAIDGINTNFAKNLALDSALFEWAVRTKQKRVLYFSSSAAYPVDNQSKAYVDYTCSEDWGVEMGWGIEACKLKEDLISLKNPRRPDANYGWAKLTGERLAEDARKNGLPVSVVRPFSGYGEDQTLDYPFPSIVRRASQGDLSCWGPPGQTRDWIHVDDVCRGALAIVDSGTQGPVNLCTGIGTEMGQLARMIWRRGTNNGYGDWNPVDTAPQIVPRVSYDESKPTGVFYRVGDPTRMLQYYTPTVSLEEGIRRALGA